MRSWTSGKTGLSTSSRGYARVETLRTDHDVFFAITSNLLSSAWASYGDPAESNTPSLYLRFHVYQLIQNKTFPHARIELCRQNIFYGKLSAYKRVNNNDNDDNQRVFI